MVFDIITYKFVLLTKRIMKVFGKVDKYTKVLWYLPKYVNIMINVKYKFLTTNHFK